MTLSKIQIDHLQQDKDSFHLFERDLIYLATRFEGWLDIAVDKGLSIEKIMQPWQFPDAGRRIAIMTWEEFRVVTDPNRFFNMLVGLTFAAHVITQSRSSC